MTILDFNPEDVQIELIIKDNETQKETKFPLKCAEDYWKALEEYYYPPTA